VNLPSPDLFVAADTLAQARERLAALLAEARKEPAAFEARLLLEGACGLDSLQLLTRAGECLGAQAAGRLNLFLGRRLGGEPVNRILGRSGFYGLDLIVTPDVLDPRNDTETLVDAALGLRLAPAATILDLGTGSGAILCALLRALPEAWGLGLDRSLVACRLARINLARCGLDRRSSVLCGNWADGLAGRFDLVVSNPPYIAEGERSDLAVEVAGHDPELALFAGADGLDGYRAIASCLGRLLKPEGRAVFEIGSRQGQSAAAVFEAARFCVEAVVKDGGGRDRALIIAARR
jgi:release factor glutamine methyltransferase